MLFIYIVLVLAIVSLVLSLKSLKDVSAKREIEHARKNLNKGRVVFQSSSSDEEESSSESSS